MEADREERYRELAVDALAALDKITGRGVGMGLLVGHADAVELLSRRQSQHCRYGLCCPRAAGLRGYIWSPAYSARAHNAAQWVREVLWLPDRQIFAYHPDSTELIHNANLLGAALISRLLPADTSPRAAVSSTLAAQAADGSWPYGSGAKNLGFVDSFHTGYVLSCLVPFADRDDVSAALARGAAYYTRQFFDRGGRALTVAESGLSRGRTFRRNRPLNARSVVSARAF